MPKKSYQVIKATTRDLSGLTVGGRPKKFKRDGTFHTSDAGEANEINKVLGDKGTGEVVVVENIQKEQGHTYTFGASKKFADAWDEMMERRKAKAAAPKKRIRRRRTRGGNEWHTAQPKTS